VISFYFDCFVLIKMERPALLEKSVAGDHMAVCMTHQQLNLRYATEQAYQGTQEECQMQAIQVQSLSKQDQ
jgi:hypothetical protein